VTSGPPPSPRDSHTCSSSKNKVIVIGGEDGHDYYLSDVHILDTGIVIFLHSLINYEVQYKAIVIRLNLLV
jgi:hypothetical protein